MEIRRAKLNDSAGLARVQVDSYLATYTGIFPPEYLEHFTYEEQEQDWREWFTTNRHPLFLAAIKQGEVVGYGFGQPNADEILPYESELVALHVRREYQRQGLGRKFISTMTRELLNHGCESMFLWVLEDNPACKFYENLGGKIVDRKAWRNNVYFGTNIYELAHGWLDMRDLILPSL